MTHLSLLVCCLSLLSLQVVAQERSATTCSSCAGQQPGPTTCFEGFAGPATCVWCADTGAANSRAGFCAASTTSFCSSRVTTASQCLPNPPAINAALISARLGAPGALGALGLLALVVLALFVYTPLERLPGAPPASTPVSPAALHILFAAAVLLWFALGLFLAAPSVPWLYVPTPANNINPVTDPSVYAASAFNIYICQYNLAFGGTPTPDLFCQSVSLQDGLTFPGFPTAGAASAAEIAAAASSIAVCVYFFALTTLLPAAIITSVSAYRIKLHLQHDIPPPTVGCSRYSHAAALALACLGAVATLAVMGSALFLAGPTVTALINTLAPGSASAGGAFVPVLGGMPGPTLAILAMACAASAAVLLLSTQCCTGLTALPGFGAQCRVVCDEAGQQQRAAAAAGAAPAVTQLNPAASPVAWGMPAQQQGKEGVPQFMVPVGAQGQAPPPPPPPPPGPFPQFTVQMGSGK